MTTPAPKLPPPPAHRRLTFSGIFGEVAAPFERWSFRLNLAPGEAGADLTAMATAGADAFVAHLRARMYSIAQLTEVKAASIGADGRYTGNPVIVARTSPGAVVSTAWFPPQVSQAISLNTGLRGARGRGRFYLPAPVGTLSPTDGAISANDAIATANAAAAFLGAINAPAGFGNVVVASGGGTLSPVLSVRVGRALDTIRSRRTDISEGYSANVNVAA